MEWLDILSKFGIPTISLSALIGFIRYFYKHIKSVKMGVQALLRAEMIDSYNHYSEKGCAPIYARTSFENVWSCYHNLGANGVMDNLRTQFMALPIELPEEIKEDKND